LKLQKLSISSKRLPFQWAQPRFESLCTTAKSTKNVRAGTPVQHGAYLTVVNSKICTGGEASIGWSVTFLQSDRLRTVYIHFAGHLHPANAAKLGDYSPAAHMVLLSPKPRACGVYAC